MKHIFILPAAFFLLSSSYAHATTVWAADFTGVPASEQPTLAPVAEANAFAWSQLNASGADPNFSVVADDGTPGIGGGNALRMNTSSNWRGMYGTFPSTASINIGDSITFAFTGRYDGTLANNGDGLRFGLVNPDSGDNNFFAQFGTGGSLGFAIFRDVPNDGLPGAGAAAVNLAAAASGTAYASIADTPYSASFTITRTAASEYEIVAAMNGAVRTATSASGWNEYNAFFIRNGGIGTPLLIDNVTVSTASDMTLLKSRVIENQTSPSVSSTTVASLRSTLAADGTWPGISYTSTASTNWQPQTHLNNLRTLARAYAKPGQALAGDASLLAEILRAYDAWISRNPTSTNWWYNQIKTPQLLGESMLLIESQLSTTRKNAGLAILGRAYVPRSTNSGTNTGANRIDRAYASLMRGLLAADANLVSESFLAIGDTILVTPKEGIQPDQSYHQHGAQLHIHGYGQVFLAGVPLYGRWAAGTSFAYDPLQVRVLVDFLLDGVQWYVRGDSLDFTSYGRGVTRSNQVAVASSFRTPITNTLALADGYRSAELQAFSSRLQADVTAASASPERALNGTRHFWRSDSTTHHRPGISYFVKTSSTRSLQPESGNGEGLKNLHLADGVTLLMRDGNEYDGIMPVWNWRNLPGTTTEQGSYSLKPASNWGVAGTSSHVGAAASGNDAVVAYFHQRLGVSARKSWFLFDDRMIALGSAIQGPQGGAPVMTSVNDCLLRGTVRYSTTGSNSLTLSAATSLSPSTLRWVHHDGIGYHFPSSGNPAGLRLSNRSRSGSWREINSTQSSTTVSRDVFALQIDHGSAPGGGSYAYIVAPVALATSMPGHSAFSSVEILRKDNAADAVRDGTRGLTGVNFWQAGEVAGIKSNAAACVLLREDASQWEISLSDPTQAGSGDLVLDLAMPAAGLLHADTHLNIEFLAAGPRLRAPRALLQGRTLRAVFFVRPNAFEILEIPADADAFAYDAQPSQSYGSGQTLTTKLISNPGFTRIAYLRFAVPPLPAAAAAASLRLSVTSTAGPGIHGLLPLDPSPWTESSLTWQNRPNPRAGPLALWLPATNTTATIDVISQMPANPMLGGTAEFSIAPQTRVSDGLVQYASREHADPALRPLLRLAIPRSEYEIWRHDNFGELAANPPVAGDLADPDQDGIPNALEFALAGNPLADSSALRPSLRLDPENQSLLFSHRRNRAAPAERIFVEASADLQSWQRLHPGTNAIQLSISPEPGESNVERLEWRIPANLPTSRFFRLSYDP